MSFTASGVSQAIARSIQASQTSLERSAQRLATGKRINTAADDPTGMGQVTRMTTTLRSTNAAITNVQQAASVSDLAGQAVTDALDTVQRMRELAMQSSSDTLSDSDRTAAQAEYRQLGAGLKQALANTKYNGKAVLGADAGALQFQIGAEADDSATLTTVNLTTDSTITGFATADLSSAGAAQGNIQGLDDLTDKLSAERSKYGTFSGRMERQTSSLQSSAAQQSTALDNFNAADFAGEAGNLANQQVLQQAGIAMLQKLQSSAAQNILRLVQ